MNLTEGSTEKGGYDTIESFVFTDFDKIQDSP